MKIAVIAACLLLVGCPFEKDMNTGLCAFVGQDIHVAIAKLGEPASEQTVAGDHVFTWTRKYWGDCTIHLTTDGANRIQHFDWLGNHRACGLYDDAISP